MLQRQREADEMESQEEEHVTDQDLTALQSEDHIQQTISHPIQIEGVNVCELWCAGRLSSLKLAQLNEVCRALSVQKNCSNSRKLLWNPLMPMLSCAHVGND